ncbi:cytochrome c maturation protein CcmE [Aestuariirhabdus sp. Z084]|uniref:cytochrome c maturation protein CcmE n=1 Tax=Aestuariirhabdus haliotis TaxID=2918751 RepID=UPI00201B3B0E|nr:cytochrome c maturation protein CcmE [Aestuariirhabdus haliotis]MCL6415545.1 cytochrome c maturation protein CcmE [Aestuariirhabdus haliotis]MCL6419250.1 cytochrome c maturation protein CcmE [Aestuariirhabdus haliotis]
MNPIRKKRLMVVLFLVFGVATAVGLALVALQQNINLFFSPTQIAQGEAPVGQRIRGGGLVVTGSVNRDSQSLLVRFDITDGAENVPVEYTGILPDLFREGQGIVAQGKIRDDGVFEAVEVLAKHDENYMPPEVQEAIDNAGHPKSTET